MTHVPPLRVELIATAIAALTALVVAAPVISIALLALQPEADLWQHLIAYVLPQALRDTTLLLLGVVAVALLNGAGTAWLVSLYEFPGRALLLWLIPLPLAIPTYIGAYIYVDLFEPLGFVHQGLTTWMPRPYAVTWPPNFRSLPGAIFVIGIVLYPYVYLSARATFQSESSDLPEAAKILGAEKWKIFWLVTLPMARPALAVGCVLVALETLNDIGASEYLGVRTLTVSVFTTWLNRGSLAGAAQIALLMLAMIGILIAVERRGRRAINTEFSSENPKTSPRTNLTGFQGILALVCCLMPPLLGFFLPAAYLLCQSIRRGLFSSFAETLWRDMLHSVMFASSATIIALLLGLSVVLARRWRPTRLTEAAVAIVRTGYALPGLVLALGLLTPVLAIDGALNAVAGMIGLKLPGLIVVGSGAAVIIAYVIRFLAVPTSFLSSSLQRIPADYDDSARAIGASRLTILTRIQLPLLRTGLFGAAIVVFVDCLKELPATLLLRPLNVETLATSIYQYASRGSFEEGALAALLIVAASIGPVIWLTRLMDRPEGTM